jgi:hypothetical protein
MSAPLDEPALVIQRLQILLCLMFLCSKNRVEFGFVLVVVSERGIHLCQIEVEVGRQFIGCLVTLEVAGDQIHHPNATPRNDRLATMQIGIGYNRVDGMNTVHQCLQRGYVL